MKIIKENDFIKMNNVDKCKIIIEIIKGNAKYIKN